MKRYLFGIFLFLAVTVSAQNMITNGDFESSFTSWTNIVGGTSVATFSVGSGTDVESGSKSMKVLVSTAGTNAYDIQSINAAWASVSGTSYTLTLWAKASSNGAQIKLVQQNTTYAEKIISLTTTYTQYSWTFTAGESGLSFKLNFPQAGTFYIDNIAIPNPNPIVAPATTTLTATPATTYQTMEGFGGAMTWYSNSILNASTSTQNQLYQLLFNDLGLDILRLKNWYFPVNYPTDKTTNAMTDNSSYNATIQFFKQAKTINPNIDVLLSSWTPPPYLKSNDSANAGTLKKDGNGKFMYSQFAQYWSDVLTAHSTSGMNPDFISIQNEPGFENTGWETCGWRPSETASFPSYGIGFDSVYNRIKKLAVGPKLIGPEVENIGSDADLNNANTFTSYTDSIRSHAGLYAYAYHLYNFGGQNAVSIASSGTSSILNTVQKYSDKQNFMTEFSTDWYDLALMIQQDLTQANASAYIHWELVWGDPTDTTGTAVMVNSSGAYTVRPPYYTLKHFAKFIDKGYQRINITSTNSFVTVSAFKNPTKNEITLVAVNTATTSTTTSFGLGSFAISAIQAYQSVYGNYYQTITGLTSTSTVSLPAQSITTIVIDYTNPITIAITAPTNNASFSATTTIPLSATEATTNGTISKVAFYNGTTLLGSTTISPFSFSWTNVPVGNYTITAVATDNNTNTATSSAILITVNPLQTIALKAGWNLISFNVSPSNKSIDSVFKTVLTNTTEIKNFDGFWEKGQASILNSLTQIKEGAAYFVNMKTATSLSVSGT